MRLGCHYSLLIKFPLPTRQINDLLYFFWCLYTHLQTLMYEYACMFWEIEALISQQPQVRLSSTKCLYGDLG